MSFERSLMFRLKHLSFLFLFFLIKANSLHATEFFCFDAYSFNAEYLYFMPSVLDIGFVSQGTQFNGGTASSAGQIQTNPPGFFSGFRVGLTYDFCRCHRQFNTTYTYLKTNTQKTVTGSNLWSAAPAVLKFFSGTDFSNYTGSAGSNQSLFYQNIDCLFSQPAWCVRDFQFRLEGGLQLSSVQSKGIFTYINSLVGAEATSNADAGTTVQGLGPKVGVSLNYKLKGLSCCNAGIFSLAGYARAGLSSGYSTGATSSNLNSVSQGKTTVEGSWGGAISFHARLGLKHCQDCLLFKNDLELGYEMNVYQYFCPLYSGSISYSAQGLYVGGNLHF